MGQTMIPRLHRTPARSPQPSMLTTPLRFHSFLRPMVWGGRRLGDVLGTALPGPESFGEAWVVSDHPSHRSVVATGPHSGHTLRDLMDREREALLGPSSSKYETFPWLVKFLDASDWLSVQVHPNEQAVRELWPGEGAKTEAWYVLHAEQGSRIYAGLLPGVGARELKAALAAGRMAECLHQFEPRAGDCVFLSAGTVHAVGGGVLMAEIQQTSDATFRLFDWNRRDAQGKMRELHIEKALASIDWSRGPVQPRRAGDGEVLVRCRYFILEACHTDQPFTCAGLGRLQLLIVLRGHGRLGGQGIARGQAWVLPACLPEIECRPDGPLEVLLCTLPTSDEGSVHAGP